MCLLFFVDDIINGTKLNFHKFLLKKKENRFDKIDGFIMVLDGKIKDLELFDFGLSDKICDKVKYLIRKKSGIKNFINYNFVKIKIDSYNYLPIKKILTFHNVIILIKLIVNKNKNKYYYYIFLEKGSHKYKSNKQYF